MGVRTRLSALLGAGDLAAAWAAIEPDRAALGRDVDLTLSWLELLEASAERPTALAEIDAALEGLEHDARVAVAAAAALLARARLHPLDEPAPPDGAAAAALRLTDRALARDDVDGELRGYLLFDRAVALRLSGPSRDVEALAAYRQALALDPDRGAWWHDLAICHKWRGRFDEALRCLDEARARMGDVGPVLFDEAACATAIGDGERAARGWRRLGLEAEVGAGGMPLVAGMPPAWVRAPATGPGTEAGGHVPDRAAGFELLSVAPLSPCHGVVDSASFRRTPVDYGDVVLWDPAPVATRARRGSPAPVFALVARLRAGDERRLRFVALQQRAGDVEAVASALPDGCELFVHRERIEHVCTRCASGDLMVPHAHEPPEEHRLVHGKLVVPGGVELTALRDAWERAIRASGRVAIAIPGLYEALDDARRAGKEHQAWRSIERSALRRLA